MKKLITVIIKTSPFPDDECMQEEEWLSKEQRSIRAEVINSIVPNFTWNETCSWLHRWNNQLEYRRSNFKAWEQGKFFPWGGLVLGDKQSSLLIIKLLNTLSNCSLLPTQLLLFYLSNFSFSTNRFRWRFEVSELVQYSSSWKQTG